MVKNFNVDNLCCYILSCFVVCIVNISQSKCRVVVPVILRRAQLRLRS